MTGIVVRCKSGGTPEKKEASASLNPIELPSLEELQSREAELQRTESLLLEPQYRLAKCKTSKVVTPLSTNKYQKTLKELRQLLYLGPSKEHKPFVWSLGEAASAQALVPGLEGFVYHQKTIPRDTSIAHTEHYYQYVLDLLAGAEILEGTVEQTESQLYIIHSAPELSREDKHDLMIGIIKNLTLELRINLLERDPSLWSHTDLLDMWEVDIVRQDIPGRRKELQNENGKCGGLFFDDFSAKLDVPINHGTLYFLGAYPRENLKSETGPGSPFCIIDHGIVSPDLGSEQMVRETISENCERGILTAFDWSLAHRSRTWAEQAPPEYLNLLMEAEHKSHLSCTIQGREFRHAAAWDDNGWRPEPYTDVVAFNLFNRDTIRYHIEGTVEVIKRYGFHCLRLDLAQQLLMDNLIKIYGGDLKLVRPAKEPLRAIIEGVKEECPWIVIAAEAYGDYEKLAMAGVDAIYDGNWFHAITPSWTKGQPGTAPARSSLLNEEHSDPVDIRALKGALSYYEFAHWQLGGPAIIPHLGDHDWVNYALMKGKFAPALVKLTYFLGGPNLTHSALEIAFQGPLEDSNRGVSEENVFDFFKPGIISWKKSEAHQSFPFGTGVGSDWHNFMLDDVITPYEEVRELLGPLRPVPLQSPRDAEWAGYLLTPINPLNRNRCLVLANLSSSPQVINLDCPKTGVRGQWNLPPQSLNSTQHFLLEVPSSK